MSVVYIPKSPRYAVEVGLIDRDAEEASDAPDLEIKWRLHQAVETFEQARNIADQIILRHDYVRVIDRVLAEVL